MLKLTEEQKKEMKEEQEHAKTMLNNEKEFNRVFEETFNEYDKNKDGVIDFIEYNEFLKQFLIKMGRKPYNIANTTMQWERADKDKNGEINKEEFKKEFTKRIKEFAYL